MSIIKSLSVGNGDMFYIVHNNDNFTIIDCCIDDNTRNDIIEEIKSKSANKSIVRFISTHPDEDHIRGLKLLNEKIKIKNFYCVKNNAIKDDETEDFIHYCLLRDRYSYELKKGCSRKWLNIGDETRKNAGINVLWPIISNKDFKDALAAVKEGAGYNNISPIFTCTASKGVKAMWMGDMEHDFLEKIKDEVDWPKVDVLFAPHHGRISGKVSPDVLKKLDPSIIVIGEAPSEHLDYYAGYNTITQNSAGDIVFNCVGQNVHVYSGNSYNVNFLTDKKINNLNYGHYLGTFTHKEAR